MEKKFKGRGRGKGKEKGKEKHTQSGKKGEAQSHSSQSRGESKTIGVNSEQLSSGEPRPHRQDTLQEPLPSNHNPLIGVLQRDTLNNVRDALHTVWEFTDKSQDQGISMSPRATMGLYWLMSCIVDALQFEIEHR